MRAGQGESAHDGVPVWNLCVHTCKCAQGHGHTLLHSQVQALLDQNHRLGWRPATWPWKGADSLRKHHFSGSGEREELSLRREAGPQGDVIAHTMQGKVGREASEGMSQCVWAGCGVLSHPGKAVHQGVGGGGSSSPPMCAVDRKSS